MAGKAEADEPFLEQPPRHFLQHRHPPPIDFDQVVIGSEDCSNLLLVLSGRHPDRLLAEHFHRKTWLCCRPRKTSQVHVREKLCEKSSMVAWPCTSHNGMFGHPRLAFEVAHISAVGTLTT